MVYAATAADTFATTVRCFFDGAVFWMIDIDQSVSLSQY